LTWRDAASVRIKLKVPATQRHHPSMLHTLTGSLFHKFSFFMDCLHMLR